MYCLQITGKTKKHEAGTTFFDTNCIYYDDLNVGCRVGKKGERFWNESAYKMVLQII